MKRAHATPGLSGKEVTPDDVPAGAPEARTRSTGSARLVLLNGEFLPEERAMVSVFDRGFLYGDGLFEVLPVMNGKPFRWVHHLARFQEGAEHLKIRLPFAGEVLRRRADELIRRNRMPDALLRLSLSRGVGMRGYSPKGAEHPTLVMSLHPLPKSDPGQSPRWKLITSSIRIPAETPHARFKTCNKLPQILARAEADDAGADEALLLGTDGTMIEGTTSNLFWVKDGSVFTPPLRCGILPGVTRTVVLEICGALEIAAREVVPRPKGLLRADGVFLSLSSWGVVPASSLDGVVLAQSPVAERIRARYAALLEEETR
jgi:branched-chain amino acid aminotransferase